MQNLPESLFSIVKTTNLSSAVLNFLQTPENSTDFVTPLGGILSDTRYGWLALGPKFCIIDLKTGLKIAARTFGTGISIHTSVKGVFELPSPLSENSQQLLISLEYEDGSGSICVFNITGSQILWCVKTDSVVTSLAACDEIPEGPFSCFDGTMIAGCNNGEIIVFDLNRTSLMQALNDIAQGNEHLTHSENNPVKLSFFSEDIQDLETQRDILLQKDEPVAVLLNEDSLMNDQFIFRNPDGSVQMTASRSHVIVSCLEYVPQIGSVAVGYNFGAFQIWNLRTMCLEFTSPINVDCLPVTHFAFQEPCDDPRAFCYLWIIFSAVDRFDEEVFPLAAMYSLTYREKRVLTETSCLYQEFVMATLRFQVDLTGVEEDQMMGGRCVACHAYCVNSTLTNEGEESVVNICHIVWECWGKTINSPSQYGMMLFDLDQWYKDQMPATCQLRSNPFICAAWRENRASRDSRPLDARLPPTLHPYTHPNRLEEHFYPNSLQYDCICLSSSEVMVLHTVGVQRQIIGCLEEAGPAALLRPAPIYRACVAAGLAPLYLTPQSCDMIPSQEEMRRYILCVALEGRLTRFLTRCARDWVAGTHAPAGCSLLLLVDWCWKRALELKENAKELIAPLFTSSNLPDRNMMRCLEHCVQQLTQLTSLLDAIITKCCSLIVPDALNEIEEKFKGVGCVSVYFSVVQWFLRVGLLPESGGSAGSLAYPVQALSALYTKRRLMLHRLEGNVQDDSAANKSCPLLYIDQLLEHEFRGKTQEMWLKGGSECNGLYPPPSLYSLLRLYLIPEVSEEHKHSLILYLLLDYSVVYDDVEYETVIRRLMQFPTMFGLSNTAIKATQAFWHLDHRDFDFALDQLQCLTGNTLSGWQHNVALASLLAQKKSQAALQYLHVRKPAPVQSALAGDANRMNDHDKLEHWRSCCNLYMARGLVFEALDVVRVCVQNYSGVGDKVSALNYFFEGCHKTGQLSKILQISLLPHEENALIKYLEDSKEPNASDILIMYYLQQARYAEARRQLDRARAGGSSEARDALVSSACAALPRVTRALLDYAAAPADHARSPQQFTLQPLSKFVQATSPKNTFTYQSSFIQNSIDNASEIWTNKTKMKRGYKRAIDFEETPFICTPKLTSTKSIYTIHENSESTPAKRSRMDTDSSVREIKNITEVSTNEHLNKEISILLDMPEMPTPQYQTIDRCRTETPQSILKIKRSDGYIRVASSPVDSRYLEESDEELAETASNFTAYSDSTNKHLRFSIPADSDACSTPSPTCHTAAYRSRENEMRDSVIMGARETQDQHTTAAAHSMTDPNPYESPLKKLAVGQRIKARKSYQDTVKARHSISLSSNASMSDEPNSSIESIADIPITLVNPNYSPSSETEHMRKRQETSTKSPEKETVIADQVKNVSRAAEEKRKVRSKSVDDAFVVNKCPLERQDSPVKRTRRGRSVTPEVSPLAIPLEVIPEQPKQEMETESHPEKTLFSSQRQLRKKSITPERVNKMVKEKPNLEAITESPSKEQDSSLVEHTQRNLRSRSRTPERLGVESPKIPSTSESLESPMVVDNVPISPRRSLRSRSRTPEVEVLTTPVPESPKDRRSRSKTPENSIVSPKKERVVKNKKSLTRLVLEANTFSKTKQHLKDADTSTKAEPFETIEDKSTKFMKCTPMKDSSKVAPMMDLTFSPITDKSVLQSSTESVSSESSIGHKINDEKSPDTSSKSLKFTTIQDIEFGKSVLQSYHSSLEEKSAVEVVNQKLGVEHKSTKLTTCSNKSILQAPINISEFGKSVLQSYHSSLEETSTSQHTMHSNIKVDKKVSLHTAISKCEPKPTSQESIVNSSEFGKSVLQSDSSNEMRSPCVKEYSNLLKSKDNISGSVSVLKDVSSLITSDSDEEANEDENKLNTMKKANQSPKDEIKFKARTKKSKDLNVSEGISKNLSEDEDLSCSSWDSINKRIAVSTTSINKSSCQSSDNSSALDEKSEDEVSFSDDSSSSKVISIGDSESENVSRNISPISQSTSESTSDKLFIVEQNNLGNPTVVCKNSSEQNEKMEINEMDSLLTDDSTLNKTDPFKDVQEDVKDDTVVKKCYGKDNNFIKHHEDSAEYKNKKVDDGISIISKSRKRSSSCSSNKSNKSCEASNEETNVQTIHTTPVSKPTQMSESNTTPKPKKDLAEKELPKDIVEESSTTPTRVTRSRSKTPIDVEIAKLQQSQKTTKSSTNENKKPKRRTSRTNSEESDASDVSVKSIDSANSKGSENRKRKSILTAVKSKLTVIPENTSEEPKESLMSEYSSSRRLTRGQSSLLRSWLQSEFVKHDEPGISEMEKMEDDPKSAMTSPLKVNTSEIASEVSAVATSDVEGSVQTENSDILVPSSKLKRSRLGRAASETKYVSEPVTMPRRKSVDLVSSESPGETRRASFRRAIEALTPKRNLRSQQDSKESATVGSPVRATRRSSTDSRTSKK